MEEAEEEVPELEGKITSLPDSEQKSVEAELEVRSKSLLSFMLICFLEHRGGDQ